jgi:hypothetical protein
LSKKLLNLYDKYPIITNAMVLTPKTFDKNTSKVTPNKNPIIWAKTFFLSPLYIVKRNIRFGKT